MQITGKVKNIELENIVLSGLKGAETVCSESLKPFEEGESVVVVTMGKVGPGMDILLNDAIFTIKTASAEDFLARFVDGLKKVENVVKSE